MNIKRLDALLGADRLADKYAEAKQHPVYSLQAWASALSADESELPYWQWVEEQVNGEIMVPA